MSSMAKIIQRIDQSALGGINARDTKVLLQDIASKFEELEHDLRLHDEDRWEEIWNWIGDRLNAFVEDHT